MKKTLTYFCLLVLVFAISGCETFKGFGQDIHNTGENIKEAVDNITD